MKTLLISFGSILTALIILLAPVVASADEEGGEQQENTPSLQELCTDGIDNNGNDLVDSADPACDPFYRVLTVVKQVVGTSTPASNFSFTVAGLGVPSLGTFSFEADGENNFLKTLIGAYSVTETSAPGYTVSYDNCGSGTEGDNALTIPENGVEETCTITNTWIPQETSTSTPPTDEGTTTPPTDEGTSTPPTTMSSSNGSGSAHGGHHSSSNGGEVLGAATCGPLLNSYLKEGSANDADAVKALQDFLNKELGLSLNLSGVFDHTTEQAVEAFQVKHWEDVLAPWVPHGLPTDHTATGYVYKTTLWKINKLFCDSLDTPAPILP